MAKTRKSAREKELREQVRASARNLPGTYRMMGERGEVLYVGKSKAVRSRLLSYFRATSGERALRILREARAVAWHYEQSEFAALLRELELIKTYRPRFNVQLKRDGRYSFLKFSTCAAPKLYVVNAVADDTATYYGPFRGGRRIQEAVRELNDALGLRDCALATPIRFADQPDLFAISLPPLCHRAELGRCIAPCAALCTHAEYLRGVALARGFLAGEAEEPLRVLADRMEQAVQRWNFEYAALLRDRAHRLETLREEFTRLSEALDELSFLYRVVGGEAGEDRVYLIRRGTIRGWLPLPRSTEEHRTLVALVREHFSRPEPATAAVAKHQVDEILLLARWFRTHPEQLEHTLPADRVDELVAAP